MSQSDFNGGFLVAMMWILTIAASIGSGILAWNWIDPDSFWGFVLFLIAWSILTRVAYFITFGVIMLLFDN